MCLFLVFTIGCNTHKKEVYVKKESNQRLEALQTYYTNHLNNCILELKKLHSSNILEEKQQYYLNARREFKLVEPILAFADKENYKSLNAPNILKVEEEDATDIKIRNPFGFQVIEEILFGEEDIDTKELNDVVLKTNNRLKLVTVNNKLYLKEYHILWLLSDAVARVALLGITGFDSPVLEQSLEEAKMNYETIQFILEQYDSSFSNKELLKDWLLEINKTTRILKGSFNDFNRYNFIQEHTHKQLVLLKETANNWKVKFPLTMAFNNNITSLFSKETFNIGFFSDYHHLEKENFSKKVVLGKRLFNDKRLSKDTKMSCATCHDQNKAFTDGRIAFENQTRNSPTLTYASLQKSFFHDGRAGSLEGQIVGVVTNKVEFHSNLKELLETVEKDSFYKNEFTSLYGKVTDFTIRNAIANYIRTLNMFNSKFDRNINGVEKTLTTQEVNGFNLFTGKAKCATCHFPPVFNGTVPPNFLESELESIGVPNLKQNKLDDDLGRYELFKTEERKHFFKTPTVRNIKETAPYMHNGTYKTLEEVVDFYNKGGGIGLGFHLDNQTLPPDELNLTNQEVSDIVVFMKSLSDNY